MLRAFRITVAVIVLLLFTAFFIDFAGWLPTGLHRLMHLQLVPALLGGMWLLAGVLLLSALLFGRLYCSVLCPLGILQDVLVRCNRLAYRIFKRKKFPYNAKASYRKPYNVLRYGLLVLTGGLFLFGSATLLLVLDPYANFGRIASSLLKPLFVWGNNALAGVLNARGDFSLYALTQYPSGIVIAWSAGVVLLLILLTARRGRLWCNTLCPVGALLGLLSRHSLWGLRIDPARCNHCNRCTARCKAECIDQRNERIDATRCVTCYNCIGTCPQQAIGYRLRYAPGHRGTQAPAAGAPSAMAAVSPAAFEAPSCDGSRRDFLRRTLASLVFIPVGKALAQADPGLAAPRRWPLPPGAADDFATRCTACQLCVARCPMQTLRPSYLERGLTGIMQPHMYFEPEVYCNYECTICSEVCPTGALQPLSVEQKKRCRAGEVRFVRTECIVFTKHQDCGACAEHCPTGAVSMVPFEDGLTIPRTDTEVCIGCGACESICPVHERAIYVQGLEPQRTALPPRKGAESEVQVDSFGF